MAASVATRQFLVHLESDRRAQFIPSLLPAMCLNRWGTAMMLYCHGVSCCRYYVAEGVKLYSQETWRLVTEGKGVRMVEENIAAVVR